MTKPQGTFKRFFYSLLRIYRVFRSVILNFIFLLLVLLMFAPLISTPPLAIPQGSALVFAPQGIIVDEETYIAPFNLALESTLNNSQSTEVLLQDVLDGLNIAAQDAAISSLILQLDSLQGAGFSKLQDIGAAITAFKNTGKKVYAIADFYTQGQYYLATYADEIILNPRGGVDLEGFSAYQTYFGSALEKLGVNVHIFRVGEYKSAVEPFERDDMSPEAKLANSAWLGDLWQIFVNDISRERTLDPGAIDEIINTFDQQVANYAGDNAELALQSGLVDSVFTRTEIQRHLENEIGRDFLSDSYKQVELNDYLRERESLTSHNSEGNIALIVASGTIYDGSQRPGSIGGDTLAALVRQATEDNNIKALVLRIDSGGGSAFASEIIRNELLEFKQTGKPFVVSMGSVAASGGYWIAAPADQIWASPSTITGSIGIFAIYPTFENTFDAIGIHTDGVGTTPLAGALAVGRNLPDIASNAIQSNLQNGYDLFLDIVAEGRGMSTDEVDNVAQGRVWSGQAAQAIGLVDELGDLKQAIAAAANLALLDSYETKLLGTPLSPAEQFMMDISENIFIKGLMAQDNPAPSVNNALMNMYQKFNHDIQEVFLFNDPKGMYLHCFECGIN